MYLVGVSIIPSMLNLPVQFISDEQLVTTNKYEKKAFLVDMAQFVTHIERMACKLCNKIMIHREWQDGAGSALDGLDLFQVVYQCPK